MGQLLDDCFLKLGRARYHLKGLENAIERWAERDSHRIRRDLEADGAQHVYRMDRIEEPDDEIPLVMGDLLYNLRATLDYFVYAEAEWGAAALGHVLTDEEKDRLQFPICLSRNDFQSQLGRGRLLHVRPATQSLIAGMQPYLREKNWRGPFFLAFLSQFSNWDKHRKFTRLIPLGFCRSYRFPDKCPQPTVQSPFGWVPLQVGAELIRFTFRQPQPEVEVETEFSLSVGIENMEALAATDNLGSFLRLVDEEILRKVSYP